MVRSASVVQPLGAALQACLSRWERNPDSKRTRASLRGCAAPEAPEPNHPVSTIAATPNPRAVRPGCRNRRKGASLQGRANCAPLHPPEVAQNPLATSAGRKPQPAHRPSAAPAGTGAACCRGRKPRRLQPRPPQRQNPRRARSCAVLTPACLRNCCLTATLWILSPLLRKVEFAVHQCRALVRAIAEKYADLAVLDAPRRAAVLALDSGRMTALLYKARLVDDQNRIWTAQLFQKVIAQLIPRRVCIPTSPVQQMLHAIRRRFLPSTQPTASYSCAHSRSTSLVNTPDLAHEALSAQTHPQSSHAPATTHASNPIIASPSQSTKNYIPERIQFITYLQL